MSIMPYKKYRPYKTFNICERTWPEKNIVSAPIWSSVDLRDGNQALPVPLSDAAKLKFFSYLVKSGFKHIEIAFPSSSQTEYDFVRKLILSGLIPDDVFIQILMPCRENHIKRSFDAIAGVKKAIIHFYHSASPLQRHLVFNKSRSDIIKMAVESAGTIKSLINANPESMFLVNYSPESFTDTEPDFALDLCHAVMDIIRPTHDFPLIIDLPATLEIFPPNIYADRIEYIHNHLSSRSSIILSAHAHNDRGTAVAASELALLAGAQRIAGTLFGNGERSGNADLITLIMNMIKRKIDPDIDFGNPDHLVEMYSSLTGMTVPKTHCIFQWHEIMHA